MSKHDSDNKYLFDVIYQSVADQNQLHFFPIGKTNKQLFRNQGEIVVNVNQLYDIYSHLIFYAKTVSAENIILDGSIDIG